MKVGLSLNTHETVAEVVEKAVEAERLGLDYLWISDMPNQLHPFPLGAAVAKKTSRVRIGFGLISPLVHPPQTIIRSLTPLLEAYGDRFELCIGPGDLGLLSQAGFRTGSEGGWRGLLQSARGEVAQGISKVGWEVAIWLGAQGPGILSLASAFNGVLLNFASPEAVRWALSQIPKGGGAQGLLRVGVYAPSYIYEEFDGKVYQLLRASSSVVALGASEKVLEAMALKESLAEVRGLRASGASLKELVRRVPEEVVGRFSIHLKTGALPEYLERLGALGVEQTVFSYPQNHSLQTIRDLAGALP